jgi:Lrp/AsnC family transcriptional regulator for asnA, asnC and gidA
MADHFAAQLDELDIKLIRELEVNALQTNVDLAKKLQINRNTVKTKFQKLLDDHVIRVLPVEDPLARGYRTRVHMGLNTLPSEVDAVAETLAGYRNIHHVAIFTGQYDLMAWAVLKKPEELPGFVTKELNHIAGITSVETMLNLEIVKNSYSYLSDHYCDLRNQPPQPALDSLDLKLIEELRNDALQTLAALAPKLGTSPSTIRRKLKRLLDEKIISIVAVADPAVLGYNTRATIGIKAQPHRVDAVAQELASFRNVQHILMNTGNFDLIVSTDSRGPKELSKFVREDLGNIQGLVSHETMVCLKTIKDDSALMT